METIPNERFLAGFPKLYFWSECWLQFSLRLANPAPTVNNMQKEVQQNVGYNVCDVWPTLQAFKKFIMTFIMKAGTNRFAEL